MELEEAIERLKRGIEDTMFSTLYSQEQEDDDVKTVLKELERYRNGEIISLKVLEHYYLVSKDKEKQMTLANKELFKEYVPKKIVDKQEKMIEKIKSKLEEHIQHCRQESQSSLHNEICRISLRFDESLLNIIEKKAEEN